MASQNKNNKNQGSNKNQKTSQSNGNKYYRARGDEPALGSHVFDYGRPNKMNMFNQAYE